MVRNMNGSGHLLHSKEVLTQGVPLVMIAYDIGILFLTCEFHTAQPQVTQPWYADDTGVVWRLEALQYCMGNMMVIGYP